MALKVPESFSPRPKFDSDGSLDCRNRQTNLPQSAPEGRKGSYELSGACQETANTWALQALLPGTRGNRSFSWTNVGLGVHHESNDLRAPRCTISIQMRVGAKLALACVFH